MNVLSLNFYSYCVRIQSDSANLIDLIRKDFSYFVQSNPRSDPDLKITAKHQTAPANLIPELTAIQQNANVVTYAAGKIRYNDYHGRAKSVFDYKIQSGEIYCDNISLLHELCFLLILSRVEKALDLRGMHKIHAFAVQKNNNCVIAMMPSMGGKSTHLMSLLKEHNIELISDDTPLVTRWGKVLPFPLRIGAHQIDKSIATNPSAIYSLVRREHGRKELLSTEDLKAKIASETPKKIYLVNGIRFSGRNGQLAKISKLKIVIPLIKNLVVGIGLPMVLEYFLESGLTDIFKNIKIIISRSMAAKFLTFRSYCFEFKMGSAIEYNTDQFVKLLDQK